MAFNQEEVLRGMRSWLYTVASKYAEDSAQVEDLAQEGWIMAWRACTAKPDHPNHAALARVAAQYRMLDVVRRDASFGSERTKGATGKARLVLLTEDELDWDERAALDDTVDQVLWSYHRGEIADAISSLPRDQQRKVYARFWRGMPTGNPTWWTRPETGARARLQEKLEHLRGLA